MLTPVKAFLSRYIQFLVFIKNDFLKKSESN